MAADILLDTLLHFFQQYGVQRTYWIAYSGGLDSQVLLSLCQQLRRSMPLQLHAIHINHGLSPLAPQWAQRCADYCKSFHINYLQQTVQVLLEDNASIEERARTLRYAVFAQQLQSGDMLLTAHQQDDQAETFLTQLVRGAGPKGLAGMPIVKPLGQGWHGRPLLSFPRVALQHYAFAQQLTWIEDESNSNVDLTRNFMRHKVLPILTTRWPTIAATIARSAMYCAEAQSLLQEYAMILYQQVQGSQAQTLSVSKLLALDRAQQKLILRQWIEDSGYLLPNAKKLDTILHSVLAAQQDRMPRVSWATVNLRRYRDDLYLTPALPAIDKHLQVSWDLSQPITLPSIGQLSAALGMGQRLRADISSVIVRLRKGGESIIVPGRGRHTLKHLWQEWGVPPWQRERIPLLFSNEQLIAVVGRCIDENYLARANELGWQITYDPFI